MREYNLKCPCGNAVRIITPGELRANIYCQLCGSIIYDKGPRQDTGRNYRKLDDYILLKSLGKGGMSEVFLGYSEKQHEKVAVKVMNVHSDERTEQHFDREVDVLQRLRHPNIIKMIDWGRQNHELYYVMEYLPGCTIEDLLQKGQLSIQDSLSIAYYTLGALQYAHQKDIIHRDIKPGNIYITSDDKIIKILDLGIAKAIYDNVSLVQTGEMLGTLYYMAPEQCKDSKRVDHRTDIYAVGATLFRMLCRYPPFGEFRNDLQKIFAHKLKDEYKRLQERKPNIPQSIVDIVEKAMAADMNVRYQSAEEMKEAVYEQLSMICE